MNLEDAQKKLKQQYLALRGVGLYVLQLPLWLALPVNLLRGKLLGVATAAVAIGLLSYAARLTQQHYRSRSANLARSGLDQADNDYRPYALAYIYNSDPADAYQAPPRHIPGHLNATLREMLSGGFDAIETLEQHANRLKNYADEADIAAQLEKITAQARGIIAHIGEEPERIRAARSFLVVHLHELRRISAAYLADIGSPDHGRQQQNFHTLLADSEHSFSAQQLQLGSAQQEHLDTQIQVLRDQLNTGNKP